MKKSVRPPLLRSKTLCSRPLAGSLAAILGATLHLFLLAPLHAGAQSASGSTASNAWADSIRAQALRDFHGADGAGKDGPLAKASVDLLTLYHANRSRKGGGKPPAAAGSGEDSVLPVRNGRVTIDALATTSATALRADLETLGLTNAAVARNVVSGRLPIGQIPAAARLASLRSVRPA